MATYAVTLVEDYPLDERSLFGIGTLYRGQTVELELTPEQVGSLRGRGIDVHPARRKAAKKFQALIDAAAARAAQEDTDGNV